MSSTLARRVAACDSISRVLVVAKINLPRSQQSLTTVLATTAVLQMTFSMPSLFCLKLSLSPPIISKKHHAASADNIGVLKAPHTAAPRTHHSAKAYSVGHGPQRVPIFFGILVGTHKKSRPRRRNGRRRTPRPNGKKKRKKKNLEK